MKRNLLKTMFLLLILLQSNAFAGQTASSDFAGANRMFAQGKYAEALPLYQKVIADPKSKAAPGDVHARIGDCYFQLQDYSHALISYRTALPKQKASQRPVTQYWIGFSAFALGRDVDAITEFLKIPELYPASGMWVGTAYYWAGRASERMGNKEQAGDYYRKAGGRGKSTQEQFALKKADAVTKSE
jgi:tetratricopeptide (TPR) repeat protein